MPSRRLLPRPVQATLVTVAVAAVSLHAGASGRLVGAAPIAPELRLTASTYLCTGYSGCRDAGYSDAGYGAVSNRMYWRMYSGHNCTNYAAYRMIKAGMPAERPWSGSGNASNWGHAMADITDDVPAVGAIAWWDRNVPGAGSAGHVAYVEKVVSADEIIISEDSWSGDFHWRRLTRDGRGWPTGFIHFIDRKSVVNTIQPRIEGTPEVDQQLVATTGRWQQRVEGYVFQWYAGTTPIAGATRSRFTPTADQVGQPLSVSVTARKTGYEDGVAVSTATPTVAAGTLTLDTPPVLSGEGQVGQVVTMTPGGWAPAPAAVTVRWKADGVLLKGQTGRTLTLTKALVGATITATEVAKRDGYTAGTTATANAVGPVVQGVVEVVTPFSMAGEALLGSALGVTDGAVSPSDATLTYTWLRDGAEIPGATEAGYRPTLEDVGRELTLRITASKPDYRSLTRTFEFGVIRTASTTTVTPKPRRHAVVLGIRVAAPGTAPGGRLTVTVGKQTLTADVVDGFARVLVTGLTSGTRRAVVEYAGDGVALPSRDAVSFRVR
ncbi:CHAP domain-containing protein [Nocardioides sp.]|uniref:CHAP domain-containing protein n=1 Tax=Nocardioides sp. TaxID=35761 RepID=UPI00351673B8